MLSFVDIFPYSMYCLQILGDVFRFWEMYTKIDIERLRIGIFAALSGDFRELLFGASV